MGSPSLHDLHVHLNESEQELYNQFGNLFLPGDSFYFIFNHQTSSVEFISEDVQQVLGYSIAQVDLTFLTEKIHPDDRSWFLSFTASIVNFYSRLSLDKLKKYKVRYDSRMQKKDDSYARILYQGVLLEHDAKGGFGRTLNVLSDISYLKQDGFPVLSFVGLYGEPSYYEVPLCNVINGNHEELTRREKQVLRLLMDGNSSKVISSILRISKQTVDTHRKNMLHKKHLNNTGELIGKAIRFGWV